MAGNALFKNPEFQKEMRSRVKRESLQRAGHAGYAALVAKGKAQLASKKAAQWRLEHPTELERIVISWLGDTKHLREQEINGFYADFVIDKLVIEVNGAQWHEKEELRQGQKQRDKRKYQTLNEAGYSILVLPECDIKSGKAKELLLKAIEGSKSIDELSF